MEHLIYQLTKLSTKAEKISTIAKAEMITKVAASVRLSELDCEIELARKTIAKKRYNRSAVRNRLMPSLGGRLRNLRINRAKDTVTECVNLYKSDLLITLTTDGGFKVFVDEFKSWEKGHKWPTVEHQVNIYLPERTKLQNIRGIITIVNPDGSARWIVQGRGLTFRVHSGWLLDGVYHVSGVASEVEARAKKEQEKELAKAAKKEKETVAIRFSDSILSGNCKAGTIAFCETAGLPLDGSITKGELRAMIKIYPQFKEGIERVLRAR